MATITIYTTKDASVYQDGNSWSGWDDHHPVGNNSNNHNWRSLVYFPISFSGWTAVNSATLYLRGSKNSGVSHVYSTQTRSIVVARMIQDWGEGTNHGENVWSTGEAWNWTNRAGQYSVINQCTSASWSGGIDDLTWYSVDVTPLVQAWYNGTGPNYGFILRANSEASGTIGVEFYARDHGSTYRPYLVIDYSTNTAPNAPTGMSPTADALVNTLLPIMTGNFSDPDAGDHMTGHQVQVFADDGTTLIWDSGTFIDNDSGGTIRSTFTTPYSGPALSGNTFYKWKGRTKDVGGLWGPYCALQRFKLNTPPNPPTISISETPNSDIRTLTPTFNVTHSDNDVADNTMYGYHVVLETSAGVAVWDSGFVDTSGAPVTVKTFTYVGGPALAWQTGYRWRAQTKDSNGVWGNNSGDLYFTTHTTGVPTNLSPNSGETISGLVPTFYAERSNANDTITSYQMLLYGPDNTTLIWDSGTLSTGIISGYAFSKVYTGTALSYATTYYWAVRATGSIGGTSGYTARTTFNTPADAAVPTQNLPTPNNSPTNNAVTSLTPTFSGSRSTAFTHYQIEVYPGGVTSGSPGIPIWDSTDTTQASATTFSRVYSGPALAWATTYKWRVRAGAPTLGNWTGLAAFTTDAAGVAVLTAPADNSWQTTATPTLSGSTSGGDNATAYRILLYESNGVTLKWDSGDISQSAATTFSKVYSGPALTGGSDYQWRARYTKSTGPTGPYSGFRSFHLNAAPSIPTQLEPVPGFILNNSVTPTFRAFFNDLDKTNFGDYPTSWVIEIRKNSDDSLIQTKTLTTGLVNGLNTYLWGTGTGGADTGLAYNTDYKWRTWFIDSKSATGAASSYQIFHAGIPPTVAITAPSNGSNIATSQPTITWTFTGNNGKTQTSFLVAVYRDLNGVLIYNSGVVVSSASTFKVPAGYLQNNGEYYLLVVYAWDTDGLGSNAATSDVQLLFAAPPRIEGLSATIYEEESRVALDWDPSALGAAFVTYVIYRREQGEAEWTMIGTKKPESNVSFSDWYAGQTRTYDYRVTVVKLIGGAPDIESPDSDIVQARLESDVWFLVGSDRSDAHIFEIPVDDEDHTRPVQSETFEPLGTNRKAIVRGFVLGHEGSIHAIWQPWEAATAKQNIEYLLYYPGPHILKNPFGDVFDVSFAGPDYKYMAGGGLGATLTWIEVGATNNPGLSPDEYLRQIGAQ